MKRKLSELDGINERLHAFSRPECPQPVLLARAGWAMQPDQLVGAYAEAYARLLLLLPELMADRNCTGYATVKPDRWRLQDVGGKKNCTNAQIVRRSLDSMHCDLRENGEGRLTLMYNAGPGSRHLVMADPTRLDAPLLALCAEFRTKTGFYAIPKEQRLLLARAMVAVEIPPGTHLIFDPTLPHCQTASCTGPVGTKALTYYFGLVWHAESAHIERLCAEYVKFMTDGDSHCYMRTMGKNGFTNKQINATHREEIRHWIWEDYAHPTSGFGPRHPFPTMAEFVRVVTAARVVDPTSERACPGLDLAECTPRSDWAQLIVPVAL